MDGTSASLSWLSGSLLQGTLHQLSLDLMSQALEDPPVLHSDSDRRITFDPTGYHPSTSGEELLRLWRINPSPVYTKQLLYRITKGYLKYVPHPVLGDASSYPIHRFILQTVQSRLRPYLPKGVMLNACKSPLFNHYSYHLLEENGYDPLKLERCIDTHLAAIARKYRRTNKGLYAVRDELTAAHRLIKLNKEIINTCNPDLSFKPFQAWQRKLNGQVLILLETFKGVESTAVC